jgi:hypothetical protein
MMRSLRPAIHFALFCALAAPWVLPLPLLAAGEPFRLTADEVEYLPGEVMVARGNVAIAGTGFIVTGDQLIYHRSTGQLVMRGNVVMKEGTKGAFTGEELTLSLLTLIGGMRKGAIRVEGANLVMTGERIRRIGPDQFEVEEGAFSTCPPGACQDWRFRARSILVEKEGYLVARGAAFYLAGIPVFYSPILAFPVKTGRQTGLLIPEFGWSSRNGVEAVLPFFLPIGESADVTLTPRTFSLSPDGAEGEVRYRAPHGGGGEWSGFALMDGAGEDQWFARGGSALELWPGTWTRLRWYGAGDPAAPGRFARSAEERDPGAVTSLAALEAGVGPATLWAVQSRLLPDARSWSPASTGLDRRQAGASLGPLRLGPLGVAGEAEDVDFGWEGEKGGRRTMASSAVLDLPDLGPLRGDLAAAWKYGPRGDGQEGFSLFSISEGATAERSYSWGVRHRVDLGVAAYRASAAAFAGTARDAGDGSRSASLLSFEARSDVAGSAFSLRTRYGLWFEEEREESQRFAEVSLVWKALTLGLSLNPDGDLATCLPNPGLPIPDGKGWSANARLAMAGGEVEVRRESQTGWDGLQGGFRLPLGRWEFTGSADYDILEERLSRAEAGVLLHGPCWEVQAGWALKPEGIDWRTSFSLTP